MMAKKQKQQPYEEKLKYGTRVVTVDGSGVIVGFSMRKNTNGGPGCQEYVCQLDGGRIRHYNANRVTPECPILIEIRAVKQREEFENWIEKCHAPAFCKHCIKQSEH